MATGTELFSYLTWPHTNILILLGFFSLAGTSSLKIWETTVLACEMFTCGVRA